MTVTPLGDAIPQPFAVLAVTNCPPDDGNVSFIFPGDCKFDAVVKDTVHVCPVPWLRRPVRAALDTHFVQGVST